MRSTGASIGLMRRIACLVAALMLASHLCGVAAAAQAGEEQMLGLLAQARARGCAGHPGTREPLRWSDSVARAAARIDRGEVALAALDREGFRATRVFHAKLSGYRGPGEVAEAFAS